jgi:hypothetical protein
MVIAEPVRNAVEGSQHIFCFPLPSLWLRRWIGSLEMVRELPRFLE